MRRNARYSGPARETLLRRTLNRLLPAAVGNPGSSRCTSGRLTKSLAYDDLGSIVSKSDVGSYFYRAPGGGAGTHPHALSAATVTVAGERLIYCVLPVRSLTPAKVW
jgi:hypothetical protein